MSNRKRAAPHTESELTQSPAIRRKLDMSFQSVANDLDDDTHSRLDALLLNTVGEAPPDPPSVFLVILLLMTMVQMSEAKLDPKFSQTLGARALLEDHPSLKDMIVTAWKGGKFKEIRNLCMWFIPFSAEFSLITPAQKFCDPYLSSHSLRNVR
jgi:hypothetical protein